MQSKMKWERIREKGGKVIKDYKGIKERKKWREITVGRRDERNRKVYGVRRDGDKVRKG
jgi:hypothetical protein